MKPPFTLYFLWKSVSRSNNHPCHKNDVRAREGAPTYTNKIYIFFLIRYMIFCWIVKKLSNFHSLGRIFSANYNALSLMCCQKNDMYFTWWKQKTYYCCYSRSRIFIFLSPFMFWDSSLQCIWRWMTALPDKWCRHFCREHWFLFFLSIVVSERVRGDPLTMAGSRGSETHTGITVWAQKATSGLPWRPL